MILLTGLFLGTVVMTVVLTQQAAMSHHSVQQCLCSVSAQCVTPVSRWLAVQAAGWT